MPKTLAEKVWDAPRRAQRRRASPTCSTSTCTSSTRSPARRRSTGSAPAGPHGPPPRPHRRHRGPQRPDRRTSISRSPTRSAGAQVEVLRRNAAEFGITLSPMGDPDQGIVHVIGPEQGRTLPGMTIVCGDSHTSTHGAFGALAFGIGTSEVEHVLATQTLPQYTPEADGGRPSTASCRPASRPRTSSSPSSARSAPAAASATSSSTAARPSEALSMEGRMTVCNMSIEAGAKAGLIAPDDTTFAYLEGRAARPAGRRLGRRASTTGDAAHRRRRRLRQRGAPRRRRADARTSPGAPTPARCLPIDGARARPGRLRRRGRPRAPPSGRWSTWA